MKAPTIQHTKNYDRFKRFNSNREVNKNHLKRLKDSIKAKNLLYPFPIVVNSDMEIVDGQHRLTAAKELGLPVYFIMDDDVTQADIAMVNNNRKGWTAMDYVQFYREQGYEPYKKLNTLLKKYPVNVIGAARLLRPYEGVGSVGGGSDSLRVRAGTIVATDYAIACDVCEVAVILYNHVEYAFRTDLLTDLKRLMQKYNLSKEYCIQRLRVGGKVLPKTCAANDPQPCYILRNILVENAPRHSVDDVKRILRQG